jgi:hypothetical protein
MSELKRPRPADRPADRSNNRTPSWAEIQARFAVTGDDSSSVPNDNSARQSQLNNRHGTLGIKRLKELVSERDLALLTSVREHRLLSSQHVYGLHFWNHASYASGIRACNRVLNRLESHRLIRRLPRPVGGRGGGSAGTIWAIDVAGDRFLRDHLKLGPGRSRPFAPSLTFQDHTLAVADTRLALEEGARRGAFDLLTVICEPDNWRGFPGELGSVLTMKPDLTVVTARGDFEDHWFIEVDRGTESGSALLRKCQTYQRYYQSGVHQKESGVFPRVLWLMPDPGRVALLQRLLADRSEIDQELFTVATADQLMAVLEQ